ncbi:MAG: rod shape-determining protein MreC [Ruminococcus sp.]|jgi:rod shape-determining protein MreC|nr:rod shape-determining protein MreC [Ruminococcus sp.]
MLEFFSDKKVKIISITIAVVIVFMIMGAAGSPILSSGVNFLTKGLSQVSASAAGEGEKTYDELLEENKALKKESADLRTQLVDYYDIKEENARLWKYYKIKKENADYEIMPASVIRRDASQDFYSFSIDVGTSNGVHNQDPVITDQGLIGFISSANAVSSKVTTILSPDLQAGAYDKRTEDSGIVGGSALYADDNKTTLTKIDANAKIKKGDIITTSGIGGIYPENLIVGKVTDINYDKYDATKYAVVTPYENIKKVTDVVVLTDFKNKGEIKRISEKEKN